MSELNAVIDTLAGLDAGPGWGHGDGELEVELTTVSRRIESVRAAATDRFHHTGDDTADGSRSAHAWTAGKVNECWGACRGVVEVGRWQREHPVMGAAFSAGEITREHLKELNRIHHSYPRLRDLLIAEEHTITG